MVRSVHSGLPAGYRWAHLLSQPRQTVLTIVQNLKASVGFLFFMMRKEIVFILVDVFRYVGVTLLPNHVILPDSSIADSVLTMKIAAFPIQLNGV